MNKLYNEEIKERYLSTFDNEGTQTTIRHVFYKSFLIEDTLGIDLYNFNLDQIGKAISNCSPLNIQSSRTIGRFISGYVEWCIEEGLRDGSNINPLKGVPQTWFDQHIDKTKKIHFSMNELFDDIIENLDNAQDQALLSLIWENVTGEKFSELRQIHYNHINWNENKIDIMNENGKFDRTIELSDRIMRYVEQAHHQSTYRTQKNDGDYTEKEILRSDYLFRNVKSPRATEGEPINFAVLYTRLKQIRETMGVEHLTPNSIRQSSMIYDAYQLYLRDGEFGLKQRNEIGDKFKLPTVINTNGKEYYNPTLMSFINAENIKMLYNIDITM